MDQSRGPTQPIAVVVDVRSGGFFSDLEDSLHHGAAGRHATLVFLEANDEVLVRRQEAARRPHPLQGDGRLLDGLQREREVLADIRGDADLVIDTSGLNVHQLTDRIAEEFGTPESVRLQVSVVSFGFKYGIPVDADFVADMRFLPNPFWVPELKPLSGQDAAVSDYVRGQAGAEDFLSTYTQLLSGVADGYLREGKRFMPRWPSGARAASTGAWPCPRRWSVGSGRRGLDARAMHRDLGRE